MFEELHRTQTAVACLSDIKLPDLIPVTPCFLLILSQSPEGTSHSTALVQVLGSNDLRDTARA